jgi:hypothetical protein
LFPRSHLGTKLLEPWKPLGTGEEYWHSDIRRRYLAPSCYLGRF